MRYYAVDVKLNVGLASAANNVEKISFYPYVA